MAPASSTLISDRIQRTIHFVRGERVMLDAALAALYDVPTRVLVQAVKRNLARFPSDFMFRLSAEEAGGSYRTLSQSMASPCFPASFGCERAIRVNIEIVRAFVQLRRIQASHPDLERKLHALERKYDANFKVVFDAIRALMEPRPKPQRRIGFRAERPVGREDPTRPDQAQLTRRRPQRTVSRA